MRKGNSQESSLGFLSNFKSRSEFRDILLEGQNWCGSVIFPGILPRIAGIKHAFRAMPQAVSEESKHKMGQRQDLATSLFCCRPVPVDSKRIK